MPSSQQEVHITHIMSMFDDQRILRLTLCLCLMILLKMDEAKGVGQLRNYRMASLLGYCYEGGETSCS
ncbi:unnamed protein product [Brassica oleracea]